MSMTYATFKAYLQQHLWKRGDPGLIEALDTLIKTADSELNRVLKVEDRNASVSLVVTQNDVALPSDYKYTRSVSMAGVGRLSYVTPAELFVLIDAYPSQQLDVYSTRNGSLLLGTDASIAVPKAAVLEYYADVPNFQTAGTSWVADEYFDVYLYCVLKHTGPFLREDERVQMWLGLFNDALQSALDTNEDVKYAGAPLTIKFT